MSKKGRNTMMISAWDFMIMEQGGTIHWWGDGDNLIHWLKKCLNGVHLIMALIIL